MVLRAVRGVGSGGTREILVDASSVQVDAVLKMQRAISGTSFVTAGN